MNNNSPTSAYQQLAARGASPVGLVVSLYDTILRDFRRAHAALLAGNVEARVFELNHALTVIAHLQSVLNFERGGEAAKTFERFYQSTRSMTLDTSVRCTPAALQELIALYSSLREAWHKIESQLPASPSVPAVSKPVAAPPNSITPDPDSPRPSNWSA